MYLLIIGIFNIYLNIKKTKGNLFLLLFGRDFRGLGGGGVGKRVIRIERGREQGMSIDRWIDG